ncbi:DUF2333 family protein [Ectothiorhodospiraceae bacterium WFHF3C12]|nr:DUF2333 family protein [Ectothiorhodospiraceae bacterium WFHF3C12]
MNVLEKVRTTLRLKGNDSAGGARGRGKWIGIGVIAVVVLMWAVSFYWSREPDLIDVEAAAKQRAPADVNPGDVTGYVTTAALVTVVETTLEKSGGYLSNDVTPPSVFLDNMPNWEYGVIVQVRDLARSLRNDMSRSRSQSAEDPDLAVADPQFSFPNNSWMFPASESEYRKGIEAVERYMNRLADPENQNTQFYARADNLREWLGLVNKRLGSLSQRLSASVGQFRVNTDLEGDPTATQATRSSSEVYTETAWTEIDDIFYEARGSTWAIVTFLKAVEVDFEDVLRNKNALVSLRQIIRELEQTQRPLYSPIILNGSGFGIFANHSLTMSSYVARANAAIIDLRDLLAQG